MSKILRLSDRINLKIGDITFVLAPFSTERKQELASCTKIENGEETYDLLKAQIIYIKNSVRDVKGLETYSGDEYTLEFEDEEKTKLTDDCVSELMNLEESSKLTTAAWQLINGIKELKDPISGEKLEGVELEVKPQGK